MPDDILPFDKTKDPALSRRTFGALSLGAGAALTTSAMAAGSIVETDVVIKTADGNCDAALFYPLGNGSWPGAVIFADALGLRPAFRDMGRRLALEGYTVLVPNPFYRTRVAPVLSGPFDFSKPEDRAKLTDLMAPLTAEVHGRPLYDAHRRSSSGTGRCVRFIPWRQSCDGQARQPTFARPEHHCQLLFCNRDQR